jgi:adenylosuccinate lyase
MLSRTHGQKATPTTFGKELKVFSSRLDKQVLFMSKRKIYAKMNGAVGNYNAHHFVLPEIKWDKETKKFLKTLDLTQNEQTTQIENHDWLAESLNDITMISNILSDFSKDIWIYIMLDYIKQKNIKSEVGSSTMPHKVNPIDFENAEGNFGISSALLEFFANKLTKSRHQRDLSDSTVLRNVGLGFGYSALAIKSAINGLSKITPNKIHIQNELNNNWEVLTEAVQTLMRYEGIPDAYEQLKKLSRGSKLDQETYITFINSLSISTDSKERLLNLKPNLYIGKAKEIAKSSY